MKTKYIIISGASDHLASEWIDAFSSRTSCCHS